MSAESHSLPHIVAHDQWCSALALVCSAPVSPLRGVVRLAGWRCVRMCVYPPIIAHHSVWAKVVRVLAMAVHVSGFLFQPRVSRACVFLRRGTSLFLLCSCHREEMLSFYLTYFFAGCRELCALLVSKFNVRFLKTQSFVFVGPGWNKNLYSAGAWGPELRTTTLNLKHTHTPTTHKHWNTHIHIHTPRPCTHLHIYSPTTTA